MNNEWHIYTQAEAFTLEQMLEIIADGETHGFEFKVENHNLYYREIC